MGNVIYLSGKHPEISLEEFKDRMFDAINESGFLPVVDIRTIDRENRMEVTLSGGEIFKITVQKMEIT